MEDNNKNGSGTSNDDNNNNNGKPAKKVLVIVDMQNDFLTGSLGGEHCRKAIPGCVKLLQEEKWEKVIITIDTHGENYLDTLEGRKLPVVHCLRNTWGQKVCREIADVVNQMKHIEEIPSNERMFVEVDKNTFGSFSLAFDIDRHVEGLDDPDGTEIHMCGVCTSICVLANAVLLRATHPNARIVIHADACGDVNEEMHRHALECLKAQQCDIVGDDDTREQDRVPSCEPDRKVPDDVPFCFGEDGGWVPATPLKAQQCDVVGE